MFDILFYVYFCFLKVQYIFDCYRARSVYNESGRAQSPIQRVYENELDAFQ